ncbi:MAG: hypothetical protein ABIK98_07545 [Pseudomonadota bacterium]
MTFKGEKDRRIGQDRRQHNDTILAPDRRSGRDRRKTKGRRKRVMLQVPVYFILQ